jgi:DNA-binding PadR family transcriptional regulator
MSLKHAVLGFLNYGPMTGYELKKFFDTSVAHFWNAELSQIYPTLKSLEAEGLVEMEVDVQQDRPNRKVYSITDDGRQDLVDWLKQPSEPEQVREPVLIKVFFGANLRRDELTAVLRDRIEGLKGGIAYLEQANSFCVSFAKSVGVENEAPFWELTTKLGIGHCRAELEWAEEAIKVLEQLDDESFEQSRGSHKAMEVQQAVQVLERITAVMPVGLQAMRGAKGEKA